MRALLIVVFCSACGAEHGPTPQQVSGSYTVETLRGLCRTYDEPIGQQSDSEVGNAYACDAYLTGYYEGYVRAQRQVHGSANCTVTGHPDYLIRRFRNMGGLAQDQPADPVLALIAEEVVSCEVGATPPQPATSSYEHVRAVILNAFRTGASLNDPRIDVLLARLSDEDRERLMHDPEVNAAIATGQ